MFVFMCLPDFWKEIHFLVSLWSSVIIDHRVWHEIVVKLLPI